MDAVSYPNEDVIDFIEENVVPLRIKADAQPLSSDFNITWTPALVMLDGDGVEHQRTVGFLSSEGLIPSILLGMAKVSFDTGNYAEAMDALKRLLEDSPDSTFVPEAIFYNGVATFKNTGDPMHLKTAYEKLATDFPDSEWTRRAYPYRLIGG
ncbi:MAG: tetratricopeptide repeat protein [Thermodesulfobacteriota bacterium]